MRTIHVDGRRAMHPIYVPPKVEQDWSDDGAHALIPASVLRNLGWPEEAISQAAKDVDHTFRECIAEYGAPICPCGAYAYTWEEA